MRIRGVPVMDSISIIWSAITGLTGVIICVIFPYLYTRASKKEVEKAKEEMATKIELKALKDDIMQSIDRSFDSLSSRMDDGFEMLSAVIMSEHSGKILPQRRRKGK